MPARLQPVLATILGLVLLGGQWSVAHAEIFRFKASLTGAAEVPASDSASSGQGEFVFDSSTSQLVFTVVYQRLTGPATAARILGPAKPGENAAAVVVTFPVPDSPISGTIRLNDAEVAALMAQLCYVNVQTAAFPEGEIRGQIVK